MIKALFTRKSAHAAGMEFFVPDSVHWFTVPLKSKLKPQEASELAVSQLTERDVKGQLHTCSQLSNGIAQVIHFERGAAQSKLKSLGNSNTIPIYVLGRCFCNKLNAEKSTVHIFALVRYEVLFSFRGEVLEHYVSGVGGKSALEGEIRRLIKFQKLSTTSSVFIHSDTSFDTLESSYIDLDRVPLEHVQASEFVSRWSVLKSLKNRLQINITASFSFKELMWAVQKNLYALIVATSMLLLLYGAWNVKSQLEDHMEQQRVDTRQINDSLNARFLDVLSRLESQSATLSARIQQANQLIASLTPQQKKLVHLLEESESWAFMSPGQSDLDLQQRTSEPAEKSKHFENSQVQTTRTDKVLHLEPDLLGEYETSSMPPERNDNKSYEHTVKMLTSNYVLVEFRFHEEIRPVRLPANQRVQIKERFHATYLPASSQVRIEEAGEVRLHPLNF